MPRALDSSIPLKGFGPSKDGQGFGKLTRQRQQVMRRATGLPEHLLPTMPAGEDVAAVEQLIRASGETAKRRRRRKQRKHSEDSGESVGQHSPRSKSTPLINSSTEAVDKKPRQRRRRTPEPEPLTRRQFEVACKALHLPAVPGAIPKPGQPSAGLWFEKLPSSDKIAMRRVLERNGARSAIIVAELPEQTEQSVEKRVQARVGAEKEAFQVLLERNRRVRAQNGRMSNGRSRRARLLDPVDTSSEEEDMPNIERSGAPAGVAALNDREKLSLLEASITRVEPNRLFVGHIPDVAMKAGKDHVERKLRLLCQNYGTITDVKVTQRFNDPDSSRVNDQSWAVVTFKPGTMDDLINVLAAQVRMSGSLLKLKLARDEDAEQSVGPGSSAGSKSIEISPKLISEDLQNYKMAHGQIDERKVDALDDELPDIGEEDSATGGTATGTAAQPNTGSEEAVAQWVRKINHWVATNSHTLNLPYYGMGEGGSAALVTAIASIEGLDMDNILNHEEVPQPSHVFRKLILKSNALAPTDAQTAAAVAEANSHQHSPGKNSPDQMKKMSRMQSFAQVGTRPDQQAVVDFEAQAKALRKIKEEKKRRRKEAIFKIQRAYRASTGKTFGSSPFSLDELKSTLDSEPRRSGVDNIGVLLSLYVAEIQKLDLSDNPLGVAGGQIIASSLDGHCPVKLKKLVLQDCKLTDVGAGAIIAVLLEQAPALTSLDLRKNGLGNDQRGDRGASAGLHDLFIEGCCELRTLKLGYNNLRPQHIRYFSPALRQEPCLQTLDLSWNSLGNDGAMWLAHALRKNTTLTTLDLTHNEIKEKGCFVIADMLKEKTSLDHIILDENPIGERGARAILRTIRKLILYGWKRLISFDKCNIDCKDKEQIFDPQEAGGHHSCNLSDPYGRSEAWGLVELAWDEDGENWIGEQHDGKPYDLEEPPPGEIWTRERFQLPETGELSLTYFSTMRPPRYTDVVEDPMVHQLLLLMSGKNVTDNGVKLLRLAAKEFFFTANMVGNLICLMKDNVSRTQIACALIPRIVDPVNVVSQTYSVLTDAELASVEKNMGKLFHFNPVNPTGHYVLQLANGFDRVLIKRLAEISEEQGSSRREQELLDTSQKGDWDNFRNETLNGQPYDFDVGIISAGALSAGVLEFDFVSTDCNHRVALLPAMPDDVFELLLQDIWDLRHKVKPKAGAGRSAGLGNNDKAHQIPFELLFPEADHALRKDGDQRGDDDVQAIVAMLKKLDFPLKSAAAVQRMCAVAQYVHFSEGSVISENDAHEDDIFILLHGVVKSVISPDRFTLINAGQFLGERAHLVGSGKPTCTLKAATDAIMIKLRIDDLKEVHLDVDLFRPQKNQSGDGRIFVDILSADDLLAMDKSGFSDPYITCKVGSQEATTTVKRQTLNPVWNERLEFSTDENPEALSIECFDWDLKGGDDPMGDGMIDLRQLGDEATTMAVPLLLDNERVGSVTLRVRRWEPKFDQDFACTVLQRAFRGHKSRNAVQKLRRAKRTMDENTYIAAAMTEQRVRQHADLLAKKQESLNQQSWVQESANKLNGLPSLSSSDSDEDDSVTPEPNSDAGSTKKAGIKDKIDWSGPDWMDKLIAERQKVKSKSRVQWYVPGMQRDEIVQTKKEQKTIVFERSLQMIRRASTQYYFSSTQVGQMLETVYDDDTYKENSLVGKPVGLNHVELLTAVFSRISDIENMDFRELLGHTTYDEDGNHSVSVDEILYLRQNPPPYVILTDRIGVANLFNPLLPDGEYALNLRVRDERQVAQMLVLLSTEPGDNMVYETFNGVPFDVGAKWLQAVPDVGWFCLQYVTPPACASLKLRTSLARRLINPGKGRWACIPREQRMHRDDPMGSMWKSSADGTLTIEDELDLPGPGEYMVDADGSLIEMNNADMAAVERAANEQKQRRKEARKAHREKVASMEGEERAATEKSDDDTRVLARKISDGGKWESYPSIQAAAMALNLPAPEVIKAARGKRDSVRGYEFTYAETSKAQGLSGGVLLSLARIKMKLAKKAESESSPVTAADGSCTPSAPTIDQDDVRAVLEVAKTVNTAKTHWRRLKRVTKMMMLLRTSGTVRQSDGTQLGNLARMMKNTPS